MEAAAPAPGPRALLTRPFLLLCTAGLFGFAQNYAIVPVIPLLVLARGGDEALAGMALAAFSVSSILVRPFIGRATDQYGRERLFAWGTGILAVGGFAYLLPGMVVLFLVRLFAGVGWAAYNTAGNVTVAALAPASRRGEATGYWGMSHSLGAMVAPTVALLLLSVSGYPAVFVFAGLMGLAAFAAAVGLSREAAPRSAEHRRGRVWEGLLERSAILPMTLEMLSTTSQGLFIAFLPLYALSLGVPIEQVAGYYALVGGVLVVARGLLARVSDLIGRAGAIAASSVLLIVGLVLLALAGDIVGLTVAGLAYAFGASMGSPTTLAMAIDRSQPATRGAAMATYSMGFQLANAIAATAWGLLIATSGFHSAFLGAIALQLALLALLFGWRRRVGPQPRAA